MYRGKFRPPPLLMPLLDGDCSEQSCPRVSGDVPKTGDQSNGSFTGRPHNGSLLNPTEQARAPRTQTNSDQPCTKESGGGLNSIAWRQKIRSLKTHRMMSADQLLRLSLNAETVVAQVYTESVHGEKHISKKKNSDAGDTLPRHQPLCEIRNDVSGSPGNVGPSGEIGEFPDLVRDHTARLNAGHSHGNEENGDIFKINRVGKIVDEEMKSEEQEEEEQLENQPLLHKKNNVCITKGKDEQKNNRETLSDSASKRKTIRRLAKSAAVENQIIEKASKRKSIRRLSRSAAVENKNDDEEKSPSTVFPYPPPPTTSPKFKVESPAISVAKRKRSPKKSLGFPLLPKLDPKVSMVRRKTLGYIESRSRGGICLICNEWVGVHHSPHSAPPRRANSSEFPSPDNSLGSAPCTPGQHSPSSPVTPHIVVSEDGREDYQDGGGGGNEEDFGDAELNMDNSEDYSGRTSRKLSRSTEDLTTGSKGELITKIQMTPDLSQNARHNSISSYLAPEVELSLQRKTRRNSMIGMIHRASSVNNLNLSSQQQQHLARVASTGNLRHGASKTSLSPSNGDWRREGNDSMIACLSALYGKILVVMGLAFPIGEFISGEMPLYIYKGFYLYLHLGSIAFLIYAYMFLLQVVPLPKVELKSRLQNFNKSRSGGARGPDVERGVAVGGDDSRSVTTLATFQNSKNYTITESTHESMYLKMGAMVFGIGSMIYSGLEVGQYFDLKSTAECADILLVISPVSRMLFTFIQMYFIFLNSRVAINKHRTIARFGLMHMIATNLCIWLNVLVEETKHEIHSLTHASGHGGDHRSTEEYDELYGHGLGTVIAQIADSALRNGTAMVASSLHSPMRGSHDFVQSFVPTATGHHIMRRGADYAAEHPSSMYDCRKSDMMSRLVDNASPFLFPCTIEYSLLCSGVLYVIWKNINKSEKNIGGDRDSDISTFIARKARHHYSVDCAHATRGLFMGILVLVLTIISLILFFVLINNENTKSVAVLEANIIELSVYSVAILTVIIGMIQMRELEFVEDGDIELDNILLLIAQTGTYIYTCFTIIGGNFSLDPGRILPFFTAVITLIQTTLQTLFILNASRRCCYTYDQLTRKPGREMVTFLLICNLAMWAISTFETSRADAHPTQLNYYGVWAWTIISHVSMPLAIFYRFHVTVCLCEIWKRSYKLKHDFL